MEYRKQQFQTYEEFTRQFPCDYSMPFARGGHGELYRGIDAETNDEVAIKRRLYSVGDDFLSLEKEYHNTQEVPANRFVVRYLYYGRYATPFGTYEYLVMRYYRDGNLTSHVLPWHQLAEPLQRRFVEEFLQGLDHLHSHNIIHRDIKPENVLLVRYTDNRQPAYRPVLADFGISKVLTDHPEIARTLVQNSMRVGTVTYMAPEQLRGTNLTYNSDLWSFGVILYEIITGKHMVARRSFPEQQREEAYGFWREVDDGRLPDDLSTVAEPYQELIRRCLVVNPRNRAQRATDLIERLHHTPTTPAPAAAKYADHPLPITPTDTPAVRTDTALTEQLDVSPLTAPHQPTPPLVRPAETKRPAEPNKPVDAPNRAVPASQLTMQLTELFDLPTVGQVTSPPRPEPQPVSVEGPRTEQPVTFVGESPGVESPTVEPPVVAVVFTPEAQAVLPVESAPSPIEPLQAEPVRTRSRKSRPRKAALQQVEPVQSEVVQAEPVQAALTPAELVPAETIPDEVVHAEPVQPPVTAVEPPDVPVETPIPAQEPTLVAPVALAPPPEHPATKPSEPVKPAQQRTVKPPRQRIPKPLPSLRPLLNQTRQAISRSAAGVRAWSHMHQIPDSLARASDSIVRTSVRAADALSRQPWLTKLMLQGWVLVILTFSLHASGSEVWLPTVVAQPTTQQSSSYQIARQRFNQARMNYEKTGALDGYLWTFVYCNRTFDDSLTQSAIHRSDTLLRMNERLFPNYRGNIAGLKRLEQKRLLLNKISWESKPHQADELSCQPQQP